MIAGKLCIFDSTAAFTNEKLRLPKNLLSGNHDHLGNVPAEFEYTQKSNKWTFPYYFYKASYAFGAKQTKVDFIFIGKLPSLNENWEF
jgi:tartrate-resistant acid phosphatase type 5